MRSDDHTRLAKEEAIQAVQSAKRGDLREAKARYLSAAEHLTYFAEKTTDRQHSQEALKHCKRYVEEAQRLDDVIRQRSHEPGREQAECRPRATGAPELDGDSGRSDSPVNERRREAEEEARGDEESAEESTDWDRQSRRAEELADSANTILPDELNESDSLSEIIGLEEVKNIFHGKLGMYAQFPHFFKPHGPMTRNMSILLFGPPGTGKTQIVRAIARHYNMPLFSVSPASVISKWVGDSPKNLAQVFDAAFKLTDPAGKTLPIVFIDEIDCIASERSSSDSESSNQLMSQLLQLTAKCMRPETPVVFIGASNRPDDIDAAVRRRLSEHIYVGLPDLGDRERIIRLNLSKLDTDLSDEDYAAAAASTELFSGGDLHNLTGSIQNRILQRVQDSTHMKPVMTENGVRMQPCSPGDPTAIAVSATESEQCDNIIPPPVRPGDLRHAITARTPTATPEMLEHFSKWHAQHAAQ